MKFVVNIYNNEKAVIPAGPYFENHFNHDLFKGNNIKVSYYIIPTNGYQRIRLIAPNGDARELRPSAIEELTDLINILIDKEI